MIDRTQDSGTVYAKIVGTGQELSSDPGAFDVRLWPFCIAESPRDRLAVVFFQLQPQFAQHRQQGL